VASFTVDSFEDRFATTVSLLLLSAAAAVASAKNEADSDLQEKLIMHAEFF
jgi:hypothetical protein